MLLFTPADLRDFGMALFGDDWEGTLAARLKVARRTINRWRDGETALPANLRAVLDALAEQQIALLEAQRATGISCLSEIVPRPPVLERKLLFDV